MPNGSDPGHEKTVTGWNDDTNSDTRVPQPQRVNMGSTVDAVPNMETVLPTKTVGFLVV